MRQKAIPKRYKKIRFKSKLEAEVAKRLDDLGIKWKYEPVSFEYQPPVKTYTPDFLVTYPDGTEEFIEVKGYFDKEARQKMLSFKQQYPEIPIALHFMRNTSKLFAKSKVTYKDWADKHGFKTTDFD